MWLPEGWGVGAQIEEVSEAQTHSWKINKSWMGMKSKAETFFFFNSFLSFIQNSTSVGISPIRKP